MTTIIVPIDVNDIVTAVATMLREWPTLQGVKVTVADEINQLPEQCPWVGVYRLGVKYPSRTLGQGAGYRRQVVELVIVAQHQSTQSGEDCCTALEALIQNVNSCLLSDPSLKGKVDTVDEFEIRYPDYQKVGGSFFQSALIYVSGVTNVGIQ